MSSTTTIRKASEEDAVPIHELHLRSVRQLCSSAYSEDLIEQWLANRTPQGYLPGIQRGEMYVTEIDGEIVGFGHAVPGEILAIFVEPTYVQRGIGTELVEYGLEIAKVGASGTVRLESTLNARRLYEKCGFTFTREMTVRRNTVDIPCLEFYLKI